MYFSKITIPLIQLTQKDTPWK
jgi:hypothetical protein